MNKLLKIYLILLLIIVVVIVTFSLLGNKERIGYFNISKNINKTLEINNLSYITNQITNYNNLVLFVNTNSSINKYAYSFKIHYYDKVFKNSDIYEVYINTNDAINNNKFITKFEIGEKGSPFGILISDKIIDDDKIDNIKYYLKIKINFILTVIIINVVILLIYFLYIIFNKIIYKKLKSIKIKSIYNIIYTTVFSIIIFIFAFIIMATIHPRYIPFKVVVISDKEGVGSVDSISWKTKYGFNELQKYNFNENEIYNIKYYTNLNIKLNDELLDLTYNSILDNLSDKNIKIYDSDKLIYSNSFSNDYIVIIDKNKMELHISSAIYNANNINTYTEGWKIKTDDFTKRYSLYFYSDLDRSIPPFRMNGTGIGDIIYENFDNIFYQKISKGTWEGYKIFCLIIASLIYTFIVYNIFKLIINKDFRYAVIHNRYIIIYIFYFFFFWGLFLSIGKYSATLVDWVFLRMQMDKLGDGMLSAYIMPEITNYIAGYRGYILPTIISYSLISLIIYYILINMNVHKFICLIFPIVLFLTPNINYGLYAAMWRSTVAGYFFVISSLSIFLLVYGNEKYKKYYIALSLISSLISFLYRSDFIPILFITIFSIIIYLIYKYKYKKINKRYILITLTLTALICLIIIKLFSFISSTQSRFNHIYYLYLFSYINPKFYNENRFTEEEKKLLRFDDTFRKLYWVEDNETLNTLEGIQKYHRFEDYHFTGTHASYISKYLDTKTLKKILIKKFLDDPYPIIYSRIEAFKYYILPFLYERGWENIRIFNIEKIFLDANLERKYKKQIYNDLLDNIVSNTGEKVNTIFYRFFGFINILIIIFLFINIKKAPITAYINIASVMYYGILFLFSIVTSYYNYGQYVLGIISIILYIYESRYVENKFDISIIKKLIKR